METFELNKIMGAILGSLLFIMGLGFVADFFYAPQELAQAAYVVEIEEAEHDAGGESEAAPQEQIAVVLAVGDAGRGESDAKKCSACHIFEAEGPTKPGPTLHGIVGRQFGAVAGYQYSDAMMARSGEAWTYENLYAFLADPKGWMPGTKMGFAGLKKTDDRADVIAYLRAITPDAPPLPEAEQQAAAEPAPAQPAPAEPAPAEPAPAESAPAESAAEAPAGAH